MIGFVAFKLLFFRTHPQCLGGKQQVARYRYQFIGKWGVLQADLEYPARCRRDDVILRAKGDDFFFRGRTRHSG